MKWRANEGLGKVYWIIAATIIILLGLAGILWWYDGYWMKTH